jgi:putative addiction module killer protein
MIVQEYVREDGTCPFRSWFDDLDVQPAAKVATAIICMELGNLSNLKWIGGGLGEYRIDWAPGYRLYLTKEGDQLIILFVGGSKKRQ